MASAKSTIKYQEMVCSVTIMFNSTFNIGYIRFPFHGYGNKLEPIGQFLCGFFGVCVCYEFGMRERNMY